MSETRKFLSPELNETTGQLLNQFYSLLRLVQIHELNNEIFNEPLKHFKTLQENLIQKEGKIEFRFFESEVFFNLVRVRLTNEVKATVLDLVREFKDKNLGGFALLEMADPEKFKGFFVTLYGYLKSEKRNAEILADSLRVKGVSEIAFFPYQEYRTKDHSKDIDHNFKNIQPLKLYAQLANQISILTSIPPGTNPTAFVDSLKKTQRTLQKLIDYCQTYPQEVLTLHQIQHYQEPLVLEAINCAILSICFGQILGLKRVEMADLGLAAIFHNRARWHLDPENYQKGWAPYFHTSYLNRDGGFNSSVYRRILTGFHYKISADGKRGKPVLKKAIIPDLYTKIVSICAQYNRLIEPPSLGGGGVGLTPHNAVKFMFLENHADFDPSLLKMFINLIGVYPIGTLVYLSTEELALVIKPPNQIQDTDKPQIIILKNTKGKPQPNKTVNLATDPRTITRSVPAAGLDIHVGHYLFTKRS